MSLAEAQDSKHDLVCRKLGLQDRTGMRLLDVGCGWGSLAIHAARGYGCKVVGVTISEQQLDAARRRVDQAGLGGQVDIRRSEEHTSELQSLMRISYAVFCLTIQQT